ncbi:hypothetical protein ACQ1ZK_19945, partial [Enterococcus faecium]
KKMKMIKNFIYSLPFAINNGLINVRYYSSTNGRISYNKLQLFSKSNKQQNFLRIKDFLFSLMSKDNKEGGCVVIKKTKYNYEIT